MPQLVAAAQVEARETLPSFHYQPAADELPADVLRLPWDAPAKSGRGKSARSNDRRRTSSEFSPATRAPWRRAG